VARFCGSSQAAAGLDGRVLADHELDFDVRSVRLRPGADDHFRDFLLETVQRDQV